MRSELETALTNKKEAAELRRRKLCELLPHLRQITGILLFVFSIAFTLSEFVSLEVACDSSLRRRIVSHDS
jgi:hypothetical protein